MRDGWEGKAMGAGRQVINSRLGRAGEPEGAGQRGWGAKRGCGRDAAEWQLAGRGILESLLEEGGEATISGLERGGR